MPSARAAAGERAGGAAALGGGRYAVYGAIAAGGMATIDYGRLIGPHGFSRDVVIKRLHPHLAKDPELVAMLVDEARLSSRVRHANVVATLDVIEAQGEIALVMEYVHGVSFAELIDRARERGESIPVAIAATVTSGALHGLHAAHEAVDEQGEPLRIVHRDVSPYNVLVGSDGVARVIDFGIAKAKGRLRTTTDGQIKGTLAYIAPEQLRGGEIDRRSDVYGASAVLWEALAGQPLFNADNESALLYAVMHAEVAPPSSVNPSVPEALDWIVMRGLSRVPEERFASAREMARAIEHAIASLPHSAIAEWLHELAGDELAARAQLLQRLQANVDLVDSEVRQVPPVDVGPRALADTQLDHSERAPRAQVVGARRIAIVAVCVIAVLGAMWMMGWGGGSAGTSASTSPNPKLTPTPTPTLNPIPIPTPTLNPTPILTPTPDPTPTLAPTPTPIAHSSKPPSAHKPRPAPPPEARHPVARPRNCVPPYVIDPQGVRHPKPECL